MSGVDPFEELLGGRPDGPERPVGGLDGRAAAIERGRRLGAQDAESRGETGEEAALRVRRAMAYAAWEHDGRPSDRSRYRKEFDAALGAGLQQHSRRSGPDSKPGGRK